MNLICLCSMYPALARTSSLCLQFYFFENMTTINFLMTEQTLESVFRTLSNI